MTRTVLVVDDEPDMELLIRQKFRKQISSGQFAFSFANNGQQALDILAVQPEIELVMTDINMPVMSGLTLLEKIGEFKYRVKTIVVSAYNDIQNIRSAMNRGAFDFVTKPIDFMDLETTLAKTFDAIDETSAGLKAIAERDQAMIMKDQAEASERFKQQFLANMSHEIRTPMNSVIGLTHLLLRTSLTDQQKKYVSMVQAASEQLMSIINDILDISKIEAGKMVFEHIGFNIKQVFSNVNDILIMKAEEKGLTLVSEIDSAIPETVVGDPSRLTQILINLVGNSIKFTSSGHVKLIAKKVPTNSNECKVEFSVQDTGIGIEKEKLGQIFESFTQANSDTSRKYGGTGLGLSISKQLVELQGGTIGVESEPGKGTRFYFTLSCPVSDEQLVVKESNQETGYTSLNKLRILLAEDNDFNKVVAEDTIHDFLKEVTLHHASDGRLAVEMVKEGDYDLVLMDIQMPEMDGYQATRAIRNLDGHKKSIAIIAMTANATPEEIKNCFDSGVDEYVSKPFVPSELFDKMVKVMSVK